MEAFEQVAKLALEGEGFAVSTGVKFLMRMKTAKKSHTEWQTHGYEVDLVGARADSLVLASVKSFFGSKGVQKSSFQPSSVDRKRYRLLVDTRFRKRIVDHACRRFGYQRRQVEVRFYAGMFHSDADEVDIRTLLARSRINVYGPAEIIKGVLAVTKAKTYRNDPVVATIRLFQSAMPRGEP